MAFDKGRLCLFGYAKYEKISGLWGHYELSVCDVLTQCYVDVFVERALRLYREYKR